MTFIQSAPKIPDSWASDGILQDSLMFFGGEEIFRAAEPELAEMGRWSTDAETLAQAMRAEREPPQLINYAPWGERIDEIKVSDAYIELGRRGVEAGVTALPYEESVYGEKARMVWAALLTMWGPSSALYSCPVAMTDAAARTLLVHGGPDELAVVDRLTTRDPSRAWTSGQWMTETAGGSDVGRTATIARHDEGRWLLFGTKWFTSATTSEMALTLARPEGAPEGSRGLSLFRIHRVLDDGSRNAIVVRRLKDKLGTRSLPTAELELTGAVAVPVGDPSEGGGVRRIATMLNITRIHNAIGSCGSLSRGLAWARAFAAVREVFGHPLGSMPAHQATLTDLAVDYAASLALVMRCCELTGKVEHNSASTEETAILRGLTPLTKLATARWAVAGAAEAMEALGGVGYCEDSGMPALVRNTHVQPIWEGTTNVLSLDVLRAAERSDSLSAVIADAKRLIDVADDPSVAAPAAAAAEALIEIRARAESIRSEGIQGTAGARSLAMGLAATYACALLCAQGAWHARRGSDRIGAMARRLAARGLVPAGPPEDLGLGMDDFASSVQSERE